jgi:hypothetical protein
MLLTPAGVGRPVRPGLSSPVREDCARPTLRLLEDPRLAPIFAYHPTRVTLPQLPSEGRRQPPNATSAAGLQAFQLVAWDRNE